MTHVFIAEYFDTNESEGLRNVLGVYRNEFKARRACERRLKTLIRKYAGGEATERWVFTVDNLTLDRIYDNSGYGSELKVVDDYDYVDKKPYTLEWETPQ